jgi:hypothetical protein
MKSGGHHGTHSPSLSAAVRFEQTPPATLSAWSCEWGSDSRAQSLDCRFTVPAPPAGEIHSAYGAIGPPVSWRGWQGGGPLNQDRYKRASPG